jgi:hypothetical protein
VSKLEKLKFYERISAFFLLVHMPTKITAIPIEIIITSAGIKIAAIGLTIPKIINMMPKRVKDIPDIISPFKPVPTIFVITSTYQ